VHFWTICTIISHTCLFTTTWQQHIVTSILYLCLLFSSACLSSISSSWQGPTVTEVGEKLCNLATGYHQLVRCLDWSSPVLSSFHAGMADCVLVNSEFTALTFGTTFKQLHARGLNPTVLYPAVDIYQFHSHAQQIPPNIEVMSTIGLPSNG
jgi:hypothetical protein